MIFMRCPPINLWFLVPHAVLRSHLRLSRRIALMTLDSKFGKTYFTQGSRFIYRMILSEDFDDRRLVQCSQFLLLEEIAQFIRLFLWLLEKNYHNFWKRNNNLQSIYFYLVFFWLSEF